MTTNSRYLPLAHPEDPTDPYANVYTQIDLVAVGRIAPGTRRAGFGAQAAPACLGRDARA